MVFNILQKIGFAICHQLPSRSLTFFNQGPCLCARCLGIYSSTFLVLGYFFGFKVLLKGERPGKLFSRRMYFFALFLILLMVADAFLQYAGVYFSNATRVISGMSFGYGLSLFLITLLVDSYAFKQKEIPFSKNERVGIAVFLAALSVVTLTLNDYILLGMHVLAILGIISVFVIANYVFISLFLQKVRRAIRWAASFVLVGIELMLLYFGHLQIQDQLLLFFEK
jgi:uncharacterized membrane protein